MQSVAPREWYKQWKLTLGWVSLWFTFLTLTLFPDFSVSFIQLFFPFVVSLFLSSCFLRVSRVLSQIIHSSSLCPFVNEEKLTFPPSTCSAGCSIVFYFWHHVQACWDAQRVDLWETEDNWITDFCCIQDVSSCTHVAILDCLRGPWYVFGKRRPFHVLGSGPSDMQNTGIA